jgi:hypothetical protein
MQNINKAELAPAQISVYEWDLLQMRIAELAGRLQAIEARTLALELGCDKTKANVTELKQWQDAVSMRLRDAEEG